MRARAERVADRELGVGRLRPLAGVAREVAHEDDRAGKVVHRRHRQVLHGVPGRGVAVQEARRVHDLSRERAAVVDVPELHAARRERVVADLGLAGRQRADERRFADVRRAHEDIY